MLHFKLTDGTRIAISPVHVVAVEARASGEDIYATVITTSGERFELADDYSETADKVMCATSIVWGY